jgi:geranylgeranyl reductase family protein
MRGAEAGAGGGPDAVVVGAGPAGAATATLLAERGLAVVLLDRARFPRDKVCGEYLSPEASRVLARLGVLPAVDASARPLRGMRLVAPDGTAFTADYPRAGPRRGYRDHALAVRRRTLDALLVARARERGVDVREGMRVTDLEAGADRITGVRGVGPGGRPFRLGARLVVGADGRASVVARRLGLVRAHPWLARLALVVDVAGAATDPERGEVFVAPPAYAIVNPVGDGLANLSVVLPAAEGPRVRGDLAGALERALAGLPALRDRLAGARRAGPVRALGPLAYRVAPPALGGVVLVGDAFGFLDPFTGDGVYTALRSAELAAEVAAGALAAGDVTRARLAPAHARRRAAFAGKERLAAGLQRVLARRWLAVAVARRLARRPGHRERLMGVLGDFAPARDVLGPRFLAGLLA